jgi:hypothetical protein
LALAAATPARAERAIVPGFHLDTEHVPDAEIEGACGVAVASEKIYVSDYYHHAVDVFRSSDGAYMSRISGNLLDGPCGLATSASGALYANDWHQGVGRLLPSALAFDSAESTGVAVDQATGDVYVNDRTYVAVYDAAGNPLPSEANPLRIGLGTLGDAYGVAVEAGRVYVPDAADDTIKVYEPAIDPVNPASIIAPGFKSLVDAAVATDSSNGHLLVVDNLEPGFELPEAAIYEFGPAGEFLGQASRKVIDGEPSGLAVSEGFLYATTGNGENADLVKFGPYVASGSLAAPARPTVGSPPLASGVALAAAGGSPDPVGAADRRSVGSPAHREVVQSGGVRVSFAGKLAPQALPRQGSAPVRVSVSAQIASTDGGPPPQLRQIAIAINRNGHFTPQGLPVCALREIQPATTANALRACRAALVGEGRFSAKVLFGQQAPFPAAGKIYAFNGRLHGKPAILAHVYGTDPVPTSFTLPFTIESTKGTFGTVLRTSLPEVTGNSGYVTGLSLNLGRSFRSHGKARSYLSAGCPAPAGFPGAVFPFAKASFGFGKKTLDSTLTRTCKAR